MSFEVITCTSEGHLTPRLAEFTFLRRTIDILKIIRDQVIT